MLTFSTTIDGPWLGVAPVRAGRVPGGLGTPDRYLTAVVGGNPIRVDLYRGNQACQFEDTRVWRGWLVVGWGEHVHWLDARDRSVRTHALGCYFGGLYPAADSLFVASAQRLFRFDPGGGMLWSSHTLGLDGVVLESWRGDVLAGRGEWDPPGGWKPFRIARDTGRPLAAGPRGD